jgi:hypothetical protein
MYNSHFVCTYSFYDNLLRNTYHKDEKYDVEDVEEFEELSELIYKTELLRALEFTVDQVESSCDNVFFNNEKLFELYNILKIDVGFMECIEKIKLKYCCEDYESGFVTLFSYDYFFLTHKCICNILNEGITSSDNINKLKEAIEQS